MVQVSVEASQEGLVCFRRPIHLSLIGKKSLGTLSSQEIPYFHRFCRRILSFMTNGARIPKGSKTLAIVERTVRSADYVVLVTLVVGCRNIISQLAPI